MSGSRTYYPSANLESLHYTLIISDTRSVYKPPSRLRRKVGLQAVLSIRLCSRVSLSLFVLSPVFACWRPFSPHLISLALPPSLSLSLALALPQLIFGLPILTAAVMPLHGMPRRAHPHPAHLCAVCGMPRTNTRVSVPPQSSIFVLVIE